jgi:hypothetical protein
MFRLLAPAQVAHEVRMPMAFVVGLLTLIGLGTVVFVILRTRNLKLRPASALGALLAALWLVPAIAATAYVVRQAVPHFDPAVADVRAYDDTRTIAMRDVRLEDDDIALRDQVTRPVSVRLGGLIELKSLPWPSPEEAVDDARQQALRVIDAAFRPAYPYELAWQAPSQILEKAVAGQSVERTRHRTEKAAFEMHVAHLTLDLSPAVRNAYAEAWHARIADIRMVVLGGLIGLATVIVIAAAAYFRLDLTTHGTYRRRLKIAAVSLIVAGALAVAQIYPFRSPAPGAASGDDDRIAQVEAA